jgi:hypothetical protein
MASAASMAADAIASMRVTGHLPSPARLGRARVRRWSVSQGHARALAALERTFSPFAIAEPLPAGDHTTLLLDGALSMTDAPFVLRNYVWFLGAAEGDVLLTGLGLGCLVRGLLGVPAVRSITVLELHADVLGLVGPHYRDPRVTLVHADALTWTPPSGRRWDCAMFDIAEDRALLERLQARYARCVRARWPNPAELPQSAAA